MRLQHVGVVSIYKDADCSFQLFHLVHPHPFIHLTQKFIKQSSSPSTVMPTQSIYSALLVLGNTEGLPWSTPTWQALTSVYGIPWSTTPGAPDDAPATHVSKWTVKIATSVKTFAENVWSKSSDVQDAYVVRQKADNDSTGRTAWKNWVRENQSKWRVNQVIDETLKEEERSPYEVMAQHGTRKVSKLFSYLKITTTCTCSYLHWKTLRSTMLETLWLTVSWARKRF